MTIGYPYNIAQGEKELVKGDVPKEVHFHLKKYSINEVESVFIIFFKD